MINDNFDNIKNFTFPLLVHMVNKLNEHHINVNVFSSINNKGLVLQYIDVYLSFKNVREVCLYLKDIYLRVKQAEENAWYKKHVSNILKEVKL